MQLFQIILVVSTAAAATITTRTASAFLAVSSPTKASSAVSTTITALNAATESLNNRWVPPANNESKFAFGGILPRTMLDDPVEDLDRHNYGITEPHTTDIQQQQQQQQQMQGDTREAETTAHNRRWIVAIQHQQHLDEQQQHHSNVEILAMVIIGAAEFAQVLVRWGKNLTMLLVCFIYLQTIL